MRRVQLAGGRAFFPPSFDELSVLRELHDARVGIAAVSVRHKNIAIRSDHDIRWLIKGVRTVSGDSRLAERHQDLPFGAELDDRVSLAGDSFPARGDGVGHPHVSVLVHMEAVRKDKHPRAKALQKLARGIELEDRRQVGTAARICPTSLADPDVAPAIHVYRARRSPSPSLRHLCPVLDGSIRIGSGIRRLDIGLAVCPLPHRRHCRDDGGREGECHSTSMRHNRSPHLEQ